VGICRVLLDGPLEASVWRATALATLVLAFAFVLGVGHRFLAPLFGVLLLFTLSYRNSWGMVFHTDNLLVVHVLVLALAPAGDAWSVDAWWRGRRKHAQPGPGEDARYGWPLKLLAALTALTYVIAGLAKLRLAGFDWLGGDELRNYVATDNLRKVLLGTHASGLATTLVAHPGLFRALAAMTMVVELGAPFALLNRRVAALWAAAAWGFHVGVMVLMKIAFPYPLLGLAFVPLFRVERPLGWIGGRVHRLWSRLRGRSKA
jgi:hypothetical protein